MSTIQLHELGADGPGLRLSIGISRSGKTFGLRRQVYRAVLAGVPVMVLDRMHEWTSLPPEVARVAVGVRSTTGVPLAAAWLQEGARLAIVQTSDVAGDALKAAEWAKGKVDESLPAIHPANHRGIAITEVHRAAPNTGNPLPELLEDVALAWAHHNVSFFCDTQRIALCNRTLTEQMRELRVYAVGRGVDSQRLKEMGGPELAAASQECARRLVAGEPGWHVKIRTVALPPYELEREAL